MYFKISILSTLSPHPYRLKHSTYLQINRFYKNFNLPVYIRGTSASNEVELGQDPEANTDSKPHLTCQ